MSKRIKVSEISHFEATKCLTIELPWKDSVLDILVVRYLDDNFAAYLNKCPHTGVNLNWQPNQCYDFSEQHLVCSLHGALFQPEDGKCIYGPCLGQSLTPIILEIEAGSIFVRLAS